MNLDYGIDARFAQVVTEEADQGGIAFYCVRARFRKSGKGRNSKSSCTGTRVNYSLDVRFNFLRPLYHQFDNVRWGKRDTFLASNLRRVGRAVVITHEIKRWAASRKTALLDILALWYRKSMLYCPRRR